MVAYPLRTAALAAAAMIGLSGCASNGLYSGVSVGMGNGYYDPYYGGYGAGYGGYGYGAGYGSYGYGAGYPYYGWYDGFYYPGTGYYVYDRYRRPFRWTDRHRRYWEGRREQSLASGFKQIATNWSEFDRSRTTATSAQQAVRSVDSPVRIDRQGRTERGIERQSRIERSIEHRRVQAERSESRAETRSSARSERRTETRSSSGSSDQSNRGRGRNRDGNRED